MEGVVVGAIVKQNGVDVCTPWSTGDGMRAAETPAPVVDRGGRGVGECYFGGEAVPPQITADKDVEV